MITRYARATDENVKADIVDIFNEDAAIIALGSWADAGGARSVCAIFQQLHRNLRETAPFRYEQPIDVSGERTAIGLSCSGIKAVPIMVGDFMSGVSNSAMTMFGRFLDLISTWNI